MKIKTRSKVEVRQEKVLILTKEEHDKILQVLNEYHTLKKITYVEFRAIDDQDLAVILPFKVEVEE
ncbi:MAG: hypothetical protein J7L07_02815 [Candidatus Odinarchaeota archaeon]|nr:hypothetical protein [Candidatus Odinarchaeota archaeon]